MSKIIVEPRKRVLINVTIIMIIILIIIVIVIVIIMIIMIVTNLPRLRWRNNWSNATRVWSHVSGGQLVPGVVMIVNIMFNVINVITIITIMRMVDLPSTCKSLIKLSHT